MALEWLSLESNLPLVDTKIILVNVAEKEYFDGAVAEVKKDDDGIFVDVAYDQGYALGEVSEKWTHFAYVNLPNG